MKSPQHEEIKYPRFYCPNCDRHTDHETITGGRKMCRECKKGHVPTLKEGEEVLIETDPIREFEEPTLE